MSNLPPYTQWGPYLSYGYDSSREMRISWETDQYRWNTTLDWGTSEKLENHVSLPLSVPDKHHCVVLKDLKPNTEYFYRIEGDLPIEGIPREERNGKIYRFRTGPPLVEEAGTEEDKNSRFEFTVTGDIHADPCSTFHTGLKAMREDAPNHAFVISVGDAINDGNQEVHWQEFFRKAEPWIHDRPFMNTTGNHETNNESKYARFIKTWDHPFVNPRLGGFYSFRYANAAFIMIDSNNAGGFQPTPSDEQYDWIEEELSKYFEKGLWIFVFLHHQIYSTGDFSMARICHEVYRPLFDEYHVDAVFYGHDHHYEAYWLGKDTEWGGTKYIVSGAGGGQERVDYSIMGPRNGQTKYIWPGRSYSYKKHGILPAPENITERAKAFRNNDIVREGQLFGILEPNFTHVSIEGDTCVIRCRSWQKQVFHEFSFKRTKKK